METTGEKVYRIHKQIIDKYVKLFTEAEDKWLGMLVRYARLDWDLHTVSQWNEELRMCFWIDKFLMFDTNVLANCLRILELTYCRGKSWKTPSFCFDRNEQELMFVVFLYLNSHPEQCIHVPILAKNIFSMFSCLYS